MRWGHQLVAHRLAFQGLKLLQWTGIQQRIFARAPYSRGSPTGSGGNEVAANTAGARSTPALILVMILRLSLRHKTKESQDKSPQEEQPFLQEQRNIAVQQEGAPLAGGRGSLAPLGHCLLLQDGQPRPPALCPFSGQPATGPHPGHALLEGPPSRDSCQSLGGSRSIRGGWARAGCAGAGHAREGNRADQGWAGAEGETPRRLQVTWPQPGPPTFRIQPGITTACAWSLLRSRGLASGNASSRPSRGRPCGRRPLPCHHQLGTVGRGTAHP